MCAMDEGTTHASEIEKKSVEHLNYYSLRGNSTKVLLTFFLKLSIMNIDGKKSVVSFYVSEVFSYLT